MYKTLRKFYMLFLKRQKKYLLILFLVLFLEGVGNVLIPKIYQYIVDGAINKANINLLLTYLLIIITLYAFITVISFASGILCTKFSSNVIIDIKTKLYKKMISQPMGYFDHTKTGKELSKIEMEVNTLEEFIANGVISGIYCVIYFLLTTTMMMMINVPITMITLLIMSAYLLLSDKIIEGTKETSRKILDINGRSIGFMTEGFQKIKTVKIFCMENLLKNKFLEIQKKNQSAKIDMSKFQLLNISLATMLFKTAEVVVWLIAGTMIINGTASLGMLTAYLQYQVNYFAPIRSISQLNGIIAKSVVAMERIFDILDLEEEQGGSAELPALVRKIEFMDVNKSLAGKNILSHVNLTVYAGETIALIGKNGSGKSTLINVLERLYPEDSGEILWDEISLKNYSVESVRKRIAILPQNVEMFNMGLKANLGLNGENTAHAQALFRKLDLQDYFSHASQGLDTVINENESNLSGGERQKLGIIRTLIKEADILILDEPSNSLDYEHRKILLKILDETSNKVKIIVTHDLEDIMKFSRVVYLQNGKIVADCKPSEFIQSYN